MRRCANFAAVSGFIAGFLVALPLAHGANTMGYIDKSRLPRVNEPIQFGRVFLKGEIAGYPQVLVNGSAVTTQANVMNRWSDGSVKHAVISFLLPTLSANQTATFTFQNQTSCNCGSGARLTKAQMLDAAFDFDATVAVGSTTISARTILNSWDGTDKGVYALPAYWADGSIATTIILGDHSSAATYDISVTGSNGPKPSLRPIFIATFWPTINKVKVRFVLEQSNTVQMQDSTYSAVLTLGSSSPVSLYTSSTTWPSGIPHRGATRWTKIGWVGGAPNDQYNLDHNLAYMASTNAVPNYDTSKTVSSTKLALDYSAWNGGAKDIYQNPGSSNPYTWDGHMGDGGGRADLGPFPAWYVRWLYTGDYRERQIMLGNADLASSFAVHIREGATGKFFDLGGTVPAIGHTFSMSARPTVGFNQEWTQGDAKPVDKIVPVGTWTSFRGPVWYWSYAHIPDAFFLPYITTGDFFYLEEMRFWTAFNAAYTPADTKVDYGRGASLKSGLVYGGEIRSEAWGIRERAEAAWAEPDGTAEQALFAQWMASEIASLDGAHGLTSSVYNGNTDWNWGRNVRSKNAEQTYLGSGTYPVIPGHSPYQMWIYGHSSAPCDSGYGVDTAVCNSDIQTFELSYLAYALSRAYELGFPTDKLIANVVGPYYVAVVTDPTYNPYLLRAGQVPAQKKAGPAYFTDMADLLTGYAGTQADCASRNCAVWRTVNSFGLSDAQNGYDILGGAAVAMTASLTSGGAAAWDWVQPRIESQSIYNDASDPRWALLPRISTSAITPPSCDQNGDGQVNIFDVQLTIGQMIGTIPCTTGDLTQSGSCNIIDVQRVINAALGAACVVGP